MGDPDTGKRFDAPALLDYTKRTMVRLSDLSQPSEPTEQPAVKSAAAADQISELVRFIEPAPKPEADLQGAAELYQRLLQESERCLDQVYQEQRVTLGEIPRLVEQALDRVTSDDAELLRLSTLGEPNFSLAAHGVNVAVLSMRVGVELGMRRASLVDVGVAALLHDIGMMKIRHLLHAPYHLNPGQIEEVKDHPIWGERIAQRSSELPPNARDVIAQEHERRDGSGYPRKLSGNDIQGDAEIVGLADMYEALTHDRPYRQRLVPAQATRVMTEQHKGAFRAPLLRAFLRGVPIFPVDSWVRLSSGDCAQVVATQSRHPLAPTVSIRYDRLRQPYPQPRTVDLSREAQFTIIEAITDPARHPAA